ncbi:MAG TPA: nickel-dependent hydrogenase large subunit [Deltaproteobacteria bacterium]|nr:nickel-dependent hydrogenase large subunit [Deltaproteobacteria bacterium]
MAQRIVIDPITRIEGHLRIEVEIAGGKVVNAWNTTTLFRGYEIILKGRDPRDAWHFSHRICGICPTPHGHTAAMSLEDSFGVRPPDNARLIRNLMEASQIAYDHILWFYILNGFDYVDIVSALEARPATPSLRRVQERIKTFVDSGQLGFLANAYWGHPEYRLPPELNLEIVAHYLESIRVKSLANEAGAVFGGKFPYIITSPPGGVTCIPTLTQIADYEDKMAKVKDFVDNTVVPDLLAIAPYYLYLKDYGGGHRNYITMGVLDAESQDPYERLFPRGAIEAADLSKVERIDLLDDIEEYVGHSWYTDRCGGGKNPSVGETEPDFTGTEGIKEIDHEGRYDWTKAVRLKGRPMEGGPLAQMLVAYASGREEAVRLVDDTLEAVGMAGRHEILFSALGRVVARVLKLKMTVDAVQGWIDELVGNIKRGDMDFYTPYEIPDSASGVAGWDAPRGCITDYNTIKGGRLERWQAVPASNWNFSPRDDNGTRGPAEEALIGVPVQDVRNPLEILRVVHSFDP